MIITHLYICLYRYGCIYNMKHTNMQWTIETKLMLYDWNAVFDQRKQLYEIDYRVAQRKHIAH